MSNINEHKPYVYLNKVGSNYELVVAVKIQSNENLSNTVSVTPANGLVTVTCEIVNQNGAAGGYKSSQTIIIPESDTRFNPTLRVEMKKGNAVQGVQVLDFTEADVAGSINGDPLPLVRLEDLGNDRYRPSLLILPEGWVLNEQVHMQTTAEAVVQIEVYINGTGGSQMNMEDLTVNCIEFEDPTTSSVSPGWAAAMVNNNGGSRRKAKIPIRNAVLP